MVLEYLDSSVRVAKSPGSGPGLDGSSVRGAARGRESVYLAYSVWFRTMAQAEVLISEAVFAINATSDTLSYRAVANLGASVSRMQLVVCKVRQLGTSAALQDVPQSWDDLSAGYV